jgi:predicted small metal-binding protein
MARKMVDCRAYPSEMNCTMTMAGEEDELLEASVAHAVAVHQHTDTPELRETLKSLMTEVEPSLA